MTIKRICSWAIGAPIAVLLVCFAVANRHWTTVSFDPINKSDPWLAVSAPTFLILFAGIFIGLIVGGIVVWTKQGKWRKQARKAHDLAPAGAEETKSSDNSALVPALRR